jgi:hypothetical protein
LYGLTIRVVARRRLPGRFLDGSAGLLDILAHTVNRVAAEHGYTEHDQQAPENDLP